MTTPYETIGVPPDASAEEIRRAYRAEISKAHPDREGGSAERAAALNTAIAIIGDAARREQYDTTGSTTDPDKRRSELAADLMTGFLAIIENHDDIDRTDIVALMVTSLRAAIETHHNAIVTLAGKERRVKRAIKRLKHKGTGPNLFGRGLDAQLVSIGKQRESLKHSITERETQIEMLADYEYQADAPKPRDDMSELIRGFSQAYDRR